MQPAVSCPGAALVEIARTNRRPDQIDDQPATRDTSQFTRQILRGLDFHDDHANDPAFFHQAMDELACLDKRHATRSGAVDCRHDGRVQAVWLGLEGQDVDQRIARYLGLSEARGMLVTQVHENAAREAGVVTGDVVWAVNGVVVDDRDHYLRILRNFTTGQGVRLDLMGAGGQRTVQVALAPFTVEAALRMASQRWGLGVRAARGQGLTITEVRPGSPAQGLGLRRGDVLLKVAGDAMESVDDFARAFKDYRMANTVLLLVGRGGRGYYVRLRVG